MSAYELIFKNWQEFAKGSFDHHDQTGELLLLENFEVPLSMSDNSLNEADLCALRFLDNEISLREYKDLNSNILLSEQQQPLNEISLGGVKDVLMDIIQVGGGAAAIVGSGGLGGDTIVDSVIAVESSASALTTIANIATSGTDLLVDLIEGIKKINLESGLKSIHRGVQAILRSIAKTFKSAKEVFNKLRGEILILIRKALRGVEKWISTIIPDDAGTVGIAIREAVMLLLKQSSKNVYDLMSTTISTLPDFAKNLIFKAGALSSFLNKTIDTIISLIDAGLEVKEKGKLAKIADIAITILQGPMITLMKKLKKPVLSFIRNHLLSKIKPKIPLAVKTARFIFTIFFGLVAAFQVIVGEEYAVAAEKELAKTVAMPAGAVTEHFKKWENYDPTAPKEISKISIKEMIVIKGNERWGIRAAIKNIAEGNRSKSKDKSIQVTWILSENKFLITDGYHRLVEELMQGNKEFLCEVDWSGYSLDWRVPELSNRFIMEIKK